jgi:hypothetical protein
LQYITAVVRGCEFLVRGLLAHVDSSVVEDRCKSNPRNNIDADRTKKMTDKKYIFSKENSSDDEITIQYLSFILAMAFRAALLFRQPQQEQQQQQQCWLPPPSLSLSLSLSLSRW